MIIPRDKYLQELKSVMHNGMIKIITGVRRCGKSYLLFELFKQSLLENGVNEEHIIQVDLEDRFARKTRNKILLRVAAAALTLGTYLAYMNLN